MATAKKTAADKKKMDDTVRAYEPDVMENRVRLIFSVTEGVIPFR